MVSKKQIIFYILVFLLFFIIAKSSLYFSNRLKINQDLSLFIGALLLTGVILLLNKFDYTKDDFFFEVTPEKLCGGGKYMRTSDPELQKMCSKFSKKQLDEFNCPVGFHGRPVNYQYSNMSDSNWENTICDNCNEYEDPRVL